MVVKTINLSKCYGDETKGVQALDGVDLEVNQGEFLAIVGTSGSGKSTLLHMLGGLDEASGGQVYIEGRRIFDFSKDEMTVFRRRNIGFVFQNYNLIEVLNVYENICLPIELDGKLVDTTYINSLLKLLGLEEKKDKLPHQLSGGQQQRVAMARALATRPKLILADEPTGNLDSRTSQEVMGLLRVSSERLNQTIIMITHNEALAQMADRVLRLEDGKIVKEVADV